MMVLGVLFFTGCGSDPATGPDSMSPIVKTIKSYIKYFAEVTPDSVSYHSVRDIDDEYEESNVYKFRKDGTLTYCYYPNWDYNKGDGSICMDDMKLPYVKENNVYTFEFPGRYLTNQGLTTIQEFTRLFVLGSPYSYPIIERRLEGETDLRYYAASMEDLERFVHTYLGR